MKDLMKLLEKKGMKPEDDMKSQAKKEIIKELIAAMTEMIGEDMDASSAEMPEHMQKVTVAAPSEEGLEEGLDKAKEIVDMMPESSDEMSEYDMMDTEDEDEEEEY